MKHPPESSTELEARERSAGSAGSAGEDTPIVPPSELASERMLEELGDDDILEVHDADTRLEVTAYEPSVPTIVPPAPTTVRGLAAILAQPIEPVAQEPDTNVTQPFRRPEVFAPSASVAPVAYSAAPPVERTLPLPRMTHAQAARAVAPARTRVTPWIVGSVAAGGLLVGGVVAGVVTYAIRPLRTMPTSSTTTTTNADAPSAVQAAEERDAPRHAEITAAQSAVTVPVESSPEIGAHGEVPDLPVTALPTAPAPVAVAAPRAPAPAAASVATPAAGSGSAPAPAVAEPPPEPVPAATTLARPSVGTVRVPPPYVVIVVDGQHRRVVDGRVVLPCGKHKIRAGMGNTEIVDVPCGGGVSL